MDAAAMTPSQIKNSKWGRAFQRECFHQWAQALEYVSSEQVEVRVFISYDRISDGECVVSMSDEEFWLDAFKYKKDAIALCKKMGWRVVK